MKAFLVPQFVEEILARLKAAGYEAFVVGGAVRDYLMGKSVSDWDVATSASPDAVRSLFRDIRNFSPKFPTVTLLPPPRTEAPLTPRSCEVTTYRGDGKTLEQDLSLRDFTVNAMAFDPAAGRIVDPHGGTRDLSLRILRAVGDPAARFREDPLRLVRAVRLSAELRFSLEVTTRKALASCAPLLSSAAAERIRDELIKILLTSRPSEPVRSMANAGLLRWILPELLEARWQRQGPPHKHSVYRHTLETVDRIPPDPLLRISALLHDIAKPRVRTRQKGRWRFIGHETVGAEMAESILRRLRFSYERIRQVQHLVLHHRVDYGASWGDAAVRRFIKRVGPSFLEPLFALRKADLEARGVEAHGDLELLAELKRRVSHEQRRAIATRTSDLAVDGHTVMRILEIGPGPRVGKILETLLEKVLEEPRLNNPRDLQAMIRDLGGAFILDH